MADKFGVEVVGIDLSVNMISLALERAIGLDCAVEFEVADCTKKSYPDDTFDVIYSRDTILHIQVIYAYYAYYNRKAYANTITALVIQYHISTFKTRIRILFE